LLCMEPVHGAEPPEPVDNNRRQTR
jgi:hypothetical protein